MKAIITGDIINSRKAEAEEWLQPLKETLNFYGSEPQTWEIYRGDSFQLSVLPQKAMWAAFHIKAAIKTTGTHDVRMSIGIGEEKYTSSKITESNGSAYTNSGDAFESLKKLTLAIKSKDESFDEIFNLMMSLSLLTANNWSSTVAETILTRIENPDLNQQEIAKILNKSQSSISEALKRGGYDEIMNMNHFYTKQIAKL